MKFQDSGESVGGGWLLPRCRRLRCTVLLRLFTFQNGNAAREELRFVLQAAREIMKREKGVGLTTRRLFEAT
jgi:hypothetical protein